ncbi:hypothetical protein [Enterovibrio norvegicus]|uniref:hypothetical protein n=1 Tax=Enterovibrio norvegicus TaxID=188144 RepID=UPI00354D264A
MRSSVYLSIFFLLCSALAVNLVVDHFFSTPSVVSAPVYKAEPPSIKTLDKSPGLMDYVEYLMSGPSDRNAMRSLGHMREISGELSQEEMLASTTALKIMRLSFESRAQFSAAGGQIPNTGDSDLNQSFEMCRKSLEEEGRFYDQSSCNSTYKEMSVFCRKNPMVIAENTICLQLHALASIDFSTRSEGKGEFDWSQKLEPTRATDEEIIRSINKSIIEAESHTLQ